MRASQAWIGALKSVARAQAEPGLTLPAMIEGWGGDDDPALEGQGGVTTRAELARRVSAVARWAAAFPRGTVFGLLLPGGAEYVALWLGIGRAGCTAALLNPGLAGETLSHAVTASGCAAVIAAPELAANVAGVPTIAPAEIVAPPAAELPAPPLPADTALLLFTSGTTGLPKAARITHARVLEWALWFAGMTALGSQDRIYDCLPLHHATGGVVAIGAGLVSGAAVWIAPAFRAGRFWAEVAAADCTVVFYIGELCRYLLDAAPGVPPHRVRLACGNGLQDGVWQHFQARFGVPAILEFYAATESSLSLYNCEGEPGAIGRIPPYLAARFPFALVRLDPATGEPARGADGLCLPCAADEPGEALGPARRFDGYTDPVASERKLLHDVLAPGDCWFRTGDLMRRDSGGFIRFVDRLGDTFRWKGENVSSTQVANLLRAAPGVADAVVYGVRLPGQEGRAGMASIVPGPGFAAETLRQHMAEALPGPAQPLFVRLCLALNLTKTFKLPTATLAAQGWAGDGRDTVLFHDRRAGRLVPLDPRLRAAILQGTMRL